MGQSCTLVEMTVHAPHLSRYLRVSSAVAKRMAEAPSVGTNGASLQIVSDLAVLLPESFRGGCSFGAGIDPVSSAKSIDWYSTSCFNKDSIDAWPEDGSSPSSGSHPSVQFAGARPGISTPSRAPIFFAVSRRSAVSLLAELRAASSTAFGARSGVPASNGGSGWYCM
jgi:hypothetical protein